VKPTLLAATALLLFAAACGGGGKDSPAIAAPTNTVDITMADIAFQPTAINAQRGERVEFVFHNSGQVPHDAFIGDAAAQADHERQMGMGGGHDMKHGDSTGITVEPGKTGRLSHTFDRAGSVEIGCHQPGHYAAGMKVTVTVA
jgi:uncharacterized cupredoxin-like copper-binding protein